MYQVRGHELGASHELLKRALDKHKVVKVDYTPGEEVVHIHVDVGDTVLVFDMRLFNVSSHGNYIGQEPELVENLNKLADLIG